MFRYWSMDQFIHGGCFDEVQTVSVPNTAETLADDGRYEHPELAKWHRLVS